MLQHAESDSLHFCPLVLSRIKTKCPEGSVGDPMNAPAFRRYQIQRLLWIDHEPTAVAGSESRDQRQTRRLNG